MSLANLNKDVNITNGVLQLKQLEIIRDYGCRILILSSSIIDQNQELWIEKECGVAFKISIKDLYLLLKPKVEGFTLNVAVAFINVVNGQKIAKIFKKLGVP